MRGSTFALLTAESACGKSTVLACLARDLDPTSHLIVYSSLATLGSFSLLASLAAKLGLRPRRFKGETALLRDVGIKRERSWHQAWAATRGAAPLRRSPGTGCCLTQIQ